MKKLMVMILAMLLTTMLIATGAVGETAAGLEAQTEGYYACAANPESTTFWVYIHMYPTGRCYYDALSSHGAGNYEFTGEVTVQVDAEGTTETFARGLKITSFLGEEIMTLGYKENEEGVGTLFGYDMWYYVPLAWSGSENKGAGIYADEVPVPIFEFYPEGDDFVSMSIGFDGTFNDTTNYELYSGTWESEGNVYTLIDETAGTYTVTVAADGKSAEAVYPDGAQQTLYAPVDPTEDKLVFAGQTFNLELYRDGNCAVVYSGSPVTEGTWSFDAQAYTLTVTLDGQEIAATMDEAYAMTVTYEYPAYQMVEAMTCDATTWGTWLIK